MSAVNEGAMRQAIPCPCGKPVKARATYCSTPCRRRAQNARARNKAPKAQSANGARPRAKEPCGARVGVLSPTTPPTEPLGVLTPSIARQDTPSVASETTKTPPLTHRNGVAVVGDRVRIWIDSPVLGSGERHLLVTAITKTTVHLYSVAALREITITRSEFEQCAESYGSNPKIVLGLLETGLRSYARLGLDHDKPSAAALDALREAAR
jgi:hypothetical protein